MKPVEPILFGCLALAATTTIGQMKNEPQQPQTKPASQSAPVTADSERGQKVFEQNCSRCHHAPEGFSPHISGTIAKHMRVRAGLSEADYKALLHFLNP